MLLSKHRRTRKCEMKASIAAEPQTVSLRACATSAMLRLSTASAQIPITRREFAETSWRVHL